ncbi:LysR family transcriptional regulator [Mesorhizobium sp. M2D.F.Ca.ET.185.01.1.1]|uniref:LysR substrate-binding domain-containing protein n=1 Tax=unclassified Mesorhizobium TaxID=325217 RepID=UPI000FCA8BB2|nr:MULTISPECIES: LysR substrate-binding domain-containing protein [unclassified Mesorhizobium]TGP56753.1 LysR family transcriptional regulator [bacterium M00.F.Ca.ET.230.01.1.1]TGP75426.1 LysR family transcriptional regulator [bacterium M00.F.Ca.ET.227.01.1.1]TGP90305.1 LysR family transcriptional regulator [bacterium M00.F.Ca.ET.222.01.1.1]TGP96450.1 LysR family transcriptional regulator [bacterium M00.F.Ca.ET.221.01.1.1]TGT67488.1 LysR family transcriptional regulator [bacterium M00.F.Ca.ET.
MEKLPPLNAMRAFEVAARAGSFTLAASELGVSSAAVSQQIRNLEDWFGKQLFMRNGNRIALTDAGHAIYPQTAHALAEIAAVSRRMLEGGLRTRLVVSVPFSLAELWLAPRVAVLLDGFPQMAIDVRVEDDPVDVVRQNIDLRISYGDYHYPALKMVRLVHDEVLPVASPDFWQRHGAADLADMHESHFIHTNWGPNYASHPSWSDWFAAAGGTRAPDPSHGRRVGLSSLAIGAARLGLGIALGQRVMARADLEAGRLIALSSVSIRLGQPYCAFMLPAKAERADIAGLVELLGSNPARVRNEPTEPK